MKAIFASKLYKASTRKGKIAAALADPVNLELVQQLDEYLSQPDEVEDALHEADKVAEQNAAHENLKAPASKIPEGPGPKVSSTSKSSDSQDVESAIVVDTHSKEIVNEPEESATDGSEAKSEEKPSDPEQESVETPLNRFHAPAKKEEKSEEESVKESTAVGCATALYNAPVKACCSPCDLVDADLIKGTLNARADTKGASRIFVKDTEMWIYYEDSVNLNSVMEPVIHVLNASGFNHFEFSRLARSKNAIVFDIICVPQELQSITGEDKK